MPAPSSDRARDCVMTMTELAELTSLSVPTLRRMIKAGTGPRVVRLGERRLGCRSSDANAWLESRAGGARPANAA